ncbi:MAG: hypothetical protein JWQ02_4477 [Capsulimonas sp.]|nr:hypothetical protein [Capsulimonas sp.]
MTTLDELRRANLREQRRSADERLAPKEPAAPTPAIATPAPAAPAATDAVAAEKAAPVPTAPKLEPQPIAAKTQQATAPLTAAPMEKATTEAASSPTAVNGAHSASNPSHAVPGAVPPADVAAIVQMEGLVERVHLALARKVIHPTGVKATVDMPPDLFWRLKRYCRDHNNVTVRQVFLDLMIAYLDEEGY